MTDDMQEGDDDGDERRRGLFQLHEWGNATIPETTQHMGFYDDALGYRAVLTQNVPEFTKNAIGPMLNQLLPSFREKSGWSGAEITDLDWALHPGGDAIITGAQEVLGLTQEQLRATRQTYKTRGNPSSAAVLTVLDLLRKMGPGLERIAWWPLHLDQAW